MRSKFFLLLAGLCVVSVGISGSLRAAETDADVPVISHIEEDRILEHDGQEVIVTGTIVTVGSTDDDSITFLNFTPTRGGFVAVVFRDNYGQFPDGLESYLNKEVRVRGVVKPYQGTRPQIQVRSPEQIEIVE